ncbi:hypothetical protein [Nocardia gipuzkoensis]|uniref:hypothetical protein n=1 Tax=Nocardia gipuzkoensis TaxID=2749991 RepID=UPI003EDECCF4
MQTDLVLVAQPTAVRCARDLVFVRLSRWGLTHVSGVIERLAMDLVSAVVRAVGSPKLGQPEAGDDIPFIRCVLWLRSGVVGFAVEDPTDVAIPTPPASVLHPTVRWDETQLAVGKATWFIVPVPSTLPRSDERDEPPSPRRFGHA